MVTPELVPEIQIIIAAEKPEKRELIQRVLKKVFAGYAETSSEWQQAATLDAAIEQINTILANLKDIQQATELVVVLSGFQGQWFEITGYLRLVQIAQQKAGQDKITIKMILMSANPRDLQNAQAEGVSVINTMMGEAAMAAFAAQILLGESVESSLTDDDLGPEYEDESQDTNRAPWEYSSFP